ncbi:Glycoside hydrolase, family 35 [Sesbania bispinosa]|nr:Glycoside hydrolase, family 35 [Sesbania bispinosa]
MSNPRIGTFLIACSAFLWACSLATTIEYDANAIIINGERRIIISGAIHYPRRTSQMWPDIIKKAKDGGLDAIETYVFWDLHEPARRQYDFSGNLDFIKFLKNVQEAGLYVVLRIGPYVCAEWNYGGFPMWLHNLPGIQLRIDNAVYKEEMETFTQRKAKRVNVDASDYLWYMTEVFINDTSSWQNATLNVTTMGHVLHAYVNGQYIGAQWGKYDNVGFIYEKPIALNQGTNVISLLSGTVGHANYGALFDLKDTGIVGGPVKLIGSDSNNIIYLSRSTWSYKVGLNGEAKRFYDPKFPNGVQWNTNNVPTGRLMTWYKTTYKTPEDYGSNLEVNCEGGKTISEIQFASCGDPQGKCGSFQKGEWESRDSPTVVERACIGKGSCSIDVTSSTFGIRKGGTNGQLAVQLLCDGSNPEDGRVQRIRG